MNARGSLLIPVQRPAGGDHAPERLRAEEPAVGVPEMTGLGKVLDPVALIGLGVGSAIEQPRSEASGARGGCEDEIKGRASGGLQHLLQSAARLELEARPIGVGRAAHWRVASQATNRIREPAQS